MNECDASWNSGGPSCGFAYDKDNEKIWASQVMTICVAVN